MDDELTSLSTKTISREIPAAFLFAFQSTRICTLTFCFSLAESMSFTKTKEEFLFVMIDITKHFLFREEVYNRCIALTYRMSYIYILEFESINVVHLVNSILISFLLFNI